jgi:hypothetical protein
MITQVELINGEDTKVYWLTHSPYLGEYSNYGLVLRAGMKLRLMQNLKEWTIRRICVSLPDDTPLPPKARVGTIMNFIG